MRKLSSYHACEKGSAAIESVFIVPLLIVIGFGAVDGSLLLLQNHKAETGLASAGRYLSRLETPQTYETQAKRLATTGQVSAGGQQTIKNWTSGNVTISYKTTANPQIGGTRNYRGGNTIKVVQLSTSIPYQGLGLIRSITGGSVNISANYEERIMS